MKMDDAMICWNRESDQVAVFRHPDRTGASRRYRFWVHAGHGNFAAGGQSVAEMSPELRLALLFIDFNTLVVRDRVDPQAAHKAFLAIDEYRRHISPDIEGAES